MHQIFFIAGLKHKGSTKPSYRSIVAAHHKSLNGCSALHTCKAILELLRNEENAEVAKSELAAIATTHSRDDRLPSHLAPFLSMLLVASLHLCPEEKFVSSNGSLLDPNMGSHDHSARNNDGITVFDVTDPSDPAYCFVSIQDLESSRRTVERDTPLTAEQYVREYHPAPQPRYGKPRAADSVSPNSSQEEETNTLNAETEIDESQILMLIQSFRRERLVELWMLHEAWPLENYGRTLDFEASIISGSSSPASVVPTLSEISLCKAIDNAQESGDTSGLEAALALPGVGASCILSMLAKLDHYTEGIIGTIVKALKVEEKHGSDSLDLSPYSLNADQVVHVSKSFPATKRLNLSGNLNIDRQTLSRLLLVLPELSRLNIYNCNSVLPSDIDAFRRLGSLEVVYHRALMTRDAQRCGEGLPRETSDDISPPSFTFYFQPPLFVLPRHSDLFGWSFKSHSPRQVVVCLHDFYECLQWKRDYTARHSITLFTVLTGLPRPPFSSFKNRTLGPIPQRETLGMEGWLYVMVWKDPNEQVDFFEAPKKFVFGFVKYRFSRDLHDGEDKVNISVRPVLESVAVMRFAEWLQEVDPQQEVERKWVERVEEKLAKFELIPEERAIELIKGIPMYDNAQSV